MAGRSRSTKPARVKIAVVVAVVAAADAAADTAAAAVVAMVVVAADVATRQLARKFPKLLRHPRAFLRGALLSAVGASLAPLPRELACVANSLLRSQHASPLALLALNCAAYTALVNI